MLTALRDRLARFAELLRTGLSPETAGAELGLSPV